LQGELSASRGSIKVPILIISEIGAKVKQNLGQEKLNLTELMSDCQNWGQESTFSYQLSVISYQLSNKTRFFDAYRSFYYFRNCRS
jgi:hypothetical protein